MDFSIIEIETFDKNAIKKIDHFSTTRLRNQVVSFCPIKPVNYIRNRYLARYNIPFTQKEEENTR